MVGSTLTNNELRAALLQAEAELKTLDQQIAALQKAGHPDLAKPVQEHIAQIRARVKLYQQAVGA